jgi:hypothetical protein
MSDFPIALTPNFQELPSGTFLVPLCLTREQYAEMEDALYYARPVFAEDGQSIAHMAAWLEAKQFLIDPTLAACFPPSDFCVQVLTLVRDG